MIPGGGAVVPINVPQRRIIYIGDLSNDVSRDIILSLMGYDMDNNDPIRVIINSYGGYIDEMFAIYDAMKACSAPIATIGIGKIMSAGVLLLAAGKKGERRMSRNTRIMIHELSSCAWGKLYEMEVGVEESKRLQSLWEGILAKECGCKKGEIKALMETHKDTYITAKEAKAFGIVDKIV